MTQSTKKKKPIKQNTLFYGDCLDVMQEMMDESVDLIYLDPPFNSNRTYNAIYKDETGRELPDQVEAFCDVWTLDATREEQISNLKVNSEITGMVGRMLDLWSASLRDKNPKLLAYLFYMAQRLLVMESVLKPTGSIYLHCDPTVSHYIKPFMDAIFGHKNFRNELIWHFPSMSRALTHYPRKHNVLLFYVNGDNYTFNWQEGLVPYKEATIKRAKYGGAGFARKEGEADYLKRDGKLVDTIWQIPHIKSKKEHMGYPTQKPLALLERIIKVSSNEGDVVLDPFCGCATTIEAAQKLNRRWIGIDIAFHAVKRVSKARLQDRCRLMEGVDYVIEGIPRTLEGARDLWKRDPYQFQKWAIEQVGGFVTTRKTVDRGIDGRIYFRDRDNNKHLSMVLEVKGGKNVSTSDVRDLRGVVEREHDGVMGGLIVLDELSERKKKGFLEEMADAKTWSDGYRSYKKMQLLSISEILDGKVFDTPYVEGKGKAQQTLGALNP